MARNEKKIRIMNLVLRDEEGVQWDNLFSLLGQLEAAAAIKYADRLVVHIESERLARAPASGEAAALVEQLSEDGQSGPVLASLYRAGAKTLVLLTVTDRG